MMFREICLFIQAQSGFGGPMVQEGHRLPNAPDRCVLISEAGGAEVFPDLPDMANVMIQVITRSRSYAEASTDSWAVYQALHGEAGWNLPFAGPGSGADYLAMTIDAISTPQYIGQDANGRFEFSTNYIFRMEQASCGPPAP
jgi:hypothetical protein